MRYGCYLPSRRTEKLSGGPQIFVEGKKQWMASCYPPPSGPASWVCPRLHPAYHLLPAHSFLLHLCSPPVSVTCCKLTCIQPCAFLVYTCHLVVSQPTARPVGPSVTLCTGPRLWPTGHRRRLWFHCVCPGRPTTGPLHVLVPLLIIYLIPPDLSELKSNISQGKPSLDLPDEVRFLVAVIV